jgi:tetratricopeptide (TPR) repeat protein
MPRSQRNDNFIDKSFTVMADIILKVFPASKREKEAFAYYRDGMSAQGDGEYAEALDNYFEALKLEDDANDRGYIFYNIGLIKASNGEHDEALEYYNKALEINPRMPQALNNVAVIFHFKGEQAKEDGEDEQGENYFDQAAEYWKRAILMAPNNYIEALEDRVLDDRVRFRIFFRRAVDLSRSSPPTRNYPASYSHPTIDQINRKHYH